MLPLSLVWTANLIDFKEWLLPFGGHSQTASRRFREGPPAAHTGGFGEPTCTACHLPASPEKPEGELRLRGLPPLYQRGRAYPLTIELTAPSLQVGGFQLAARFAEGAARGRQAGQFRVPAGLKVIRADSTGVEYLHHTAEAISAKRDTIRWQFEWLAPSSGGSVVFHFAANASDDDASPLGDRILTGSQTSKEAPPPAPTPEWSKLHHVPGSNSRR